jgi:dTDP-glucose pyrophosphorylase
MKIKQQYVNDPHRYGVAGFDEKGNVTSIEEKLCCSRTLFLSK